MGKLKIETLGTSFTILANENEEYLNKLLGYYKQITQEVQKIQSVKTPLQVAILSGIMIVDELYKEKEKSISLESGIPVSENTKDTEEIERRTKEMIDKINKVL